MNKDTAIESQRLSIQAIRALSELLLISQGHYSENEYENRRKIVASIIGRIQIDLLDPLYKSYPELDDLRYISDR